MQPMTALGAALYHDYSIAQDPLPAEALLDALLGAEEGLIQFCVPIAPRKEAPRPLRRDSLFARVKRGELASFLVGTPAQAPDADAITIGFVLVPSTAAAQEGRAGFPADSASFAHAYASGTRGGLTEEQDRRVNDVFYATYELGDRIRGPEWGTFLGAHHVEKLGGRDRIEREAGCAVVRPLAHGGLYLQLTERLDAPHTLDALAAFLAPVR